MKRVFTNWSLLFSTILISSVAVAQQGWPKTISAANGKAVLDGGLGAQHLNGGNGADVLIGGPGDVIAGGTSAGTAADKSRRGPDGKRPLDLFLKIGDTVEVSSSKIGALANKIVASE